MLESQLIETKLHPTNDAGEEVGILIINPNGALDVSDFDRLTQKVDTYLEKHSRLHAALIYTEDFPGWVNFASLISHLKFVRLHHQKIEKIALVTNTVLADEMMEEVEERAIARERQEEDDANFADQDD